MKKLTSIDTKRLNKEAIKIRRDTLDMVYRSKDGHMGAALSMVEILLVLYSKVLNVSSKKMADKERDRFILSKGHGCPSLYAVLARYDFFPRKELGKFCACDGLLCGHPSHKKTPGVELSTGSLGHGFPMGVGFALAAKLEKSKRKVYCLVGDGECNEGSIWEAAAVSAHFKLDNLTVIVDYNKMQSSGKVTEIQNPHDLKLKWSTFGWDTQEIDGHNFDEIYTSLADKHQGKPKAIIAHTKKAKGIPFMEQDMEHDNKWHTGIPTEDEYHQALKELTELENKL